MALILSIETSTAICSVALHSGGNLIAYQEVTISRSHAESLFPMIHHLLQDYTMQDLGAIAVSEGPGSYTGLRIGAATATGLCYALDIPLIAINTLEAMVAQVDCDIAGAWFCPMIDARRMEVYCLLADAGRKIVVEAHPHIVTADSFQAFLAAHAILFFGDGAMKCEPLFAHQQNAIFVADIYPSAKQIGFLAYENFKVRKFVAINEFTPQYLKPFESLQGHRG